VLADVLRVVKGADPIVVVETSADRARPSVPPSLSIAPTKRSSTRMQPERIVWKGRSAGCSTSTEPFVSRMLRWEARVLEGAR
jgi:hypothetical protein